MLVARSNNPQADRSGAPAQHSIEADHTSPPKQEYYTDKSAAHSNTLLVDRNKPLADHNRVVDHISLPMKECHISKSAGYITALVEHNKVADYKTELAAHNNIPADYSDKRVEHIVNSLAPRTKQ